MARCRPGRLAQQRHRRVPGDADRLATGLVHPAEPRRAAGDPGRRTPGARLPRHLLRQLGHLPRGVRTPGEGAVRALRQPSGAEDVARPQRVRHVVLLLQLRPGVPGLAAAALPDARRRQRRVEHGLLVAALLALGRDRAAAGDAVSAEPGSGAGLPPLPVGLAPAPLPGAEGGAHQRPAGHHQLRPGRLGAGRPRPLGPRGGPRRDRPLPGARPRRGGAAGVRRRPGPGLGGSADRGC